MPKSLHVYCRKLRVIRNISKIENSEPLHYATILSILSANLAARNMLPSFFFYDFAFYAATLRALLSLLCRPSVKKENAGLNQFPLRSPRRAKQLTLSRRFFPCRALENRQRCKGIQQINKIAIL